jgi:ribosomal protein S20
LKGKINFHFILIKSKLFSVLADIRRHLKNSNRTAAMKLLRKKKLLEREHDKKESTIEHLNSVLTQIEQTDCSSLVEKSLSQ